MPLQLPLLRQAGRRPPLTVAPRSSLDDASSSSASVPGAEGEVSLDRLKACAINVGSVGQSRDGDLRAAYGIFDPERYSYTQRRVSYDVERAMRRITEAGLPEENAARLLRGE